jgi:hypothetical protein
VRIREGFGAEAELVVLKRQRWLLRCVELALGVIEFRV